MLKGWRTLIFSFIVAAVGVLTATDWTQVIPDGPNKGWVLIGIAFVTAWLRVITSTPVFRKEFGNENNAGDFNSDNYDG